MFSTSSRPFLLWTAIVACGSVGPAQGSREDRFAAGAAVVLHRHATACLKAGHVQWAVAVWLELLGEYAPDYEPARTALGYRRVGASWAIDTDLPNPRAVPQKPARSDALHDRWEQIARDLGRGHRDLARHLDSVDDSERARHHYRRALRFVPTDRAAGEALGYESFAGHWGDGSELALLRRSHWLRQVVRCLSRTVLEVEPLPPSARHPLLEKAGVAHRGVKSENFVIWGDLPTGSLVEAALWSERCLLFCRAVFADAGGFRDRPSETAEMALFGGVSVWQRVLRGNADLFEGDQLRFLLENCRTAYLNGSGMLLAAAVDDRAQALDQVVRAVAQDLSALQSAALDEGIGHTVVAMFFGQNLTFIVDRGKEEHPHTVSRRKDGRSVLPPDLEAWGGIALDVAWTQSAAAAAELPLVAPDNFSIGDRVKAWALVDYLVRRDPSLLRALEDAADGAADPGDVRRAFRSRSGGIDLAGVERDWRQLWTESAGLLGEAMRREVPSRTATQRAALTWMKLINDRRLALERPPIAWVETVVPNALVVRGSPDKVVAAWEDGHAMFAEQLRVAGFHRGGGVVSFDLEQ